LEFSGQNKPDDMITQSSLITYRFKSNNRTEGRGFKIEYRPIDTGNQSIQPCK
jgi:hypothetical protein